MIRQLLAAAVLATVSVAATTPGGAHPFAPHEIENALLSADSGQVPVKCGTPLILAAQASRTLLSSPAQAALDKMLAPAALDQSFLSAGGHFEIQYSIAGTDSIPVTDADASGTPDYVEWVAEAMEQSWQKEIVELGFFTIPLGAGEHYVVKLTGGSSFYGATYNSAAYPGGSYITIQPRFDRFFQTYPYLAGDDPDGAIRGGIRVTAAHEFKHAIQWLRSGWSEGGWLELDATFMEDVVFDQVNDYYNYLTNGGSPFTSPTTTLVNASYEDSTWEHFLLERWGWPLLHAFWVRRGQVFDSETPQRTYQVALTQQGHDWVQNWGEYETWNYASGIRATSGFGFSEADSFPTPPVIVIDNTNDYQSASFSLTGMAARYHELDNSARLRKGEVTLRFEGSSAVPWSAGVLLQHANDTQWLPAMIEAGVGSLTTTGVGAELYDRVAVIVGNASTAGAGGSYTFRLSTTDVPIHEVERPSMGGLKSRYLPPNP